MERKNRRNAVLGVVDVETTPIVPGERPRTRFWGLYIEGRSYERFGSSADLVDYLSSLSFPLRLYHHHDFDICQLIVDGILPSGMVSRAGRIIRSTVAGTMWINSFALFPSSLAAVLESCGYSKKALGLAGHSEWCVCPGCKTALDERNQSDCVDAMHAFRTLSNIYWSACGIDPLEEGFATAASCAFVAAERAAGPMPVDLANRASYRGGRVEAFRLGLTAPDLDAWSGVKSVIPAGEILPYYHEGTVDAWDITSSYPYAFADAPSSDRLIRARVRVDVDREAAPFPVEGGESLIFPNGEFTTWLYESNYERYIRPYGGIESIDILESYDIDLTWLKRAQPLIDRAFFVRHASTTPANRYMMKIFINSVYGRIGMKPDREVVRVQDGPEFDRSCIELPDGRWIVFARAKSAPRANYALAGYITDNARARLYQALRETRSLYCDTDSVYTTDDSCLPGPVGTGMGEWKHEGSGSFYASTVKDYVFNGALKRKGGDRSTVWSVRRALAGRSILGIDRTRKTLYGKREVYPDGSTAPLTIYA